MQNSWINCNRSSDLMEMKLYNAIDRLDQFKLHAYLAIVLINFAFLIQIKNISFSRNGFYKFLESESLVKYFNGLGSDTDKRSNFWFSCYTWCTGEIRSKICFSYQNLKSAHDVTLFGVSSHRKFPPSTQDIVKTQKLCSSQELKGMINKDLI